jgi:hypothetical protein
MLQSSCGDVQYICVEFSPSEMRLRVWRNDRIGCIGYVLRLQRHRQTVNVCKRGCARMMGDRQNRSCHFCPSLPTRVTKAKHHQKHAREMLRSLGRSSKSLFCCYNCRNETTLRIGAVSCQAGSGILQQCAKCPIKIKRAYSCTAGVRSVFLSQEADGFGACPSHCRLCQPMSLFYKTFANPPISSSQKPKAVKLC